MEALLIPCRFAELGCKAWATEVVYAPSGCICWKDPVQALCDQHLITMESQGPVALIADLRGQYDGRIRHRKGNVPASGKGGVALPKD